MRTYLNLYIVPSNKMKVWMMTCIDKNIEAYLYEYVIVSLKIMNRKLQWAKNKV